MGARVALVIAGVGLALVLAELFCRVDAFFPGHKYSSAGSRALFATHAEGDSTRELDAYVAAESKTTARSMRSFVHPFQGWTHPIALTQLREETSWYADAAASDAAFDVLILGGSVAAIFGNLETAHLVDGLEKFPRLAGRKVRVWNEGMAAYKAPQPLHLLEWELALGHRPDAIVLIDGFNEVAVAAGNVISHTHPLYPYTDYWGPMVHGREVDMASLDELVAMRFAQREEADIARRALACGYQHSALLTRITLARLADRRRAFEDARDAYLLQIGSDPKDPMMHGPPFEGGVDDAVDLAIRSWSDCAREVHTLCVEHGIVEVHVLQPALADAEMRVATAEEEAASAHDATGKAAVKRGYPLLRAAGHELAAGGLPFDDATRIFEHEAGTLYSDVCHFNQRGNDLLCDYVVGVLRSRLR